MWRGLSILLICIAGCGGGNRPLAIGSAAPDFALPGADGKTHTLAEYAASPVLAVVFTCNHCRASQLYEARLRKLDEDYRAKGVRLVAINSDRADAIPLSELASSDVGDSLADMKARVAYRRIEYPYLYDGDTQSVAAKFHVETLPHIFLFDRDRKLRYEGRIDDNVNESLVQSRDPRNVNEPLVHNRDARNAIEAMLAGRRVPVERTEVAGCALLTASKTASRQQELAKIQAEPVALQMADEAALKKLRGNPTGKLLLVNFWATWCGPCVTEFPELETTYRMYRTRGFDFVSVSANDPDDKPQVIEFLKKNHASGLNYQFATPDTFGLQAAFDPAMPAAVPFTLLIAPNGDVLFQQLGELDFLKLRRAILANLTDDPALQGYWSASAN
jgi:thiol-disulfide isomerase/thioredoxin